MKILAKSALYGFGLLCCAGTLQAWADETACKTMREATYARTRVPHSVVIETTQAARKPIHGQEIYLKNVRYQLLLGHWVKSITSPQQEIDGEKKLSATFSGCLHERDSMLYGQPVAIYSAKTRNLTLVPFSGDLRMWISRRTGVPLRSEANASIPFLGNSHTVKIFSYDKIRAPAAS